MKKRQTPTQCLLCTEQIPQVSYQDTPLLRRFMSGQNKILPRKKTSTCARHQRLIAREIKRGRQAGLLRYRGQ